MQKIWTDQALKELDLIYNYYAQKSEQGANNVINDILESVDQLSFPDQYQQYEYAPAYRRIVVRDYLILYKGNKQSIYIHKIISSKQNPTHQL